MVRVTCYAIFFIKNILLAYRRLNNIMNLSTFDDIFLDDINILDRLLLYVLDKKGAHLWPQVGRVPPIMGALNFFCLKSLFVQLKI